MRAWRCALWVAFASPLAAQSPVWLDGTVAEPGGRPVAAAEVAVWSAERRVAAGLTDADGRFRLGPLPEGAYEVRVRAVGFRPVSVARARSEPAHLGTVTLQPAVIALDAVVVTASRREERLADVPVTTELISRRDIEQSGAPDLVHVLLDQTGIQPQGGVASGAGVMLQGLGDERVLVLVDGEPFIGRIDGQLDLGRLPVASVERIEIVRGPQSTLYGSDAMGGVVNVITRQASGGTAGQVAFLGGSHGRRDASLRFDGGGDPVRVSLDLGRRDADVVSGRADSANASQGQWDGLLKAEYTAGSWTLLAGGQGIAQRQRWRSGPLWFLNDNRQWSARFGVRGVQRGHRLSLTAYATAYRHHARRSTIPDPPDSIGDRETQGLEKLEALYGYAAGRHTLDAGVDLERERITSDRVAGARRRQLSAEPFVQETVTLGPFGLVLGARASMSDRWGTALTPRVALRWRPTPQFAVRAGAGGGYRAPDFKELDIEFLNVGPGFGYVVRGNPDLRPERSTNVTAGVEVATGAWFARVQSYHTRFTNFIEAAALPDSGGLQVFSYDNRAAGRTAGLDAEAAMLFGGFRLDAGYGWLATHDDESDGPLLGRPTHSARGGVAWTSPAGPRVRVGAVFTGSAPVRRADDGTLVTRDGFLRLDARVTWPVVVGVDLAAGVDNLFAARPAEWPGFTGRQIYAGASWRVGAH